MTNEQRSEKPTSDTEGLEIHSMWNTIQGEGPFNGSPALFIRMAGCNLQCRGCDTDYTSNRTKVDPNTLARTVFAYVNYMMTWSGIAPLIVLSGGEPFRQAATMLFVTELARLSVEALDDLPLGEVYSRDDWISKESQAALQSVDLKHGMSVDRDERSGSLSQSFWHFVSLGPEEAFTASGTREVSPSQLARAVCVQVETNGTLYPKLLDAPTYQEKLYLNTQPSGRPFFSVVVSPKTESIHQGWYDREGNGKDFHIADPWHVSYKYVYMGNGLHHSGTGIPTTPFLEAPTGLHPHTIPQNPCRSLAPPPAAAVEDSRVWIQPFDFHGDVPSGMSDDIISDTINLCQRFGFRLSIQQHKALGLP